MDAVSLQDLALKAPESQGFLANNLIARVAERHSDVRDQTALNKWLDRRVMLN
jgi:hypothetical protein